MFHHSFRFNLKLVNTKIHNIRVMLVFSKVYDTTEAYVKKGVEP